MATTKNIKPVLKYPGSTTLSPSTIPPWLYGRTDLTPEDKWNYLHLCQLTGDGVWKADRKMLIETMGIDASGDIEVYRRLKRLIEGGLITVQYDQERGPWSRGYKNVWTFRMVPQEQRGGT